MNNKYTVKALTAAVALACTPAVAADKELNVNLDVLTFAKVDKNDDKLVTKKELAYYYRFDDAVLVEVDANNDMKLTEAEFDTFQLRAESAIEKNDSNIKIVEGNWQLDDELADMGSAIKHDLARAGNKVKAGAKELARDAERMGENVAEELSEVDIDPVDVDPISDGFSELELPEPDMDVADLHGMTVINMDEKDLGEVEEVVKNNLTGQTGVITGVGGFLGLGEKFVFMPFEKLTIAEDKIILDSYQSVDKLKQKREYFETNYTPYDRDMLISMIHGNSQKELQSAFNAFDKNNNGVLEQVEVNDNTLFTTQWSEADKDNNNKIDRSEFAAMR